MVTDYPYRIASRSEIVASRSSVGPDRERIGASVFRRMREMFCGLHGHDNFLQFEQDRMCLKCVSCGHETPGWELNEAPPTRRLQGDTRRHKLARRPLADVRRIA